MITNVVGAARIVAPAAPVITSDPVMEAINETSATINWTTDINTTNDWVYYSVDTSYSQSQSSTAGGTDHSITISGLSGNTTYNFRVGSAANGLSSADSFGTFTTLSGSTYLVSEDFEGAGIPSGWSDSGVINWDDTLALEGSQSWNSAIPSYYSRISFAANSTIWLYARTWSTNVINGTYPFALH